MANDRDTRVRQRAYELWEKAGRPAGKHEDHWHQASSEVSEAEAVGMTTPMPPAAAKRGKVMAADVAPSLVKKRK